MHHRLHTSVYALTSGIHAQAHNQPLGHNTCSKRTAHTHTQSHTHTHALQTCVLIPWHAEQFKCLRHFPCICTCLHHSGACCLNDSWGKPTSASMSGALVLPLFSTHVLPWGGPLFDVWVVCTILISNKGPSPGSVSGVALVEPSGTVLCRAPSCVSRPPARRSLALAVALVSCSPLPVSLPYPACLTCQHLGHLGKCTKTSWPKTSLPPL